MRVSPNQSAAMLSAVTRAQEQESKASMEISSGRRVSVPSDDPAAMALGMEIGAQLRADDAYLQSLGSVRALLSTADSALNSVVTDLQRAVTLGMQGASGSLSAEQRRAIAQEVRGIRDSVLGLANLSFRGTFVFAGTATATEPFVESSGIVVYQGNAGLNEVSLGSTGSIQTNLPGGRIFAAAGANVFVALDGLAAALEVNDADAIATATNSTRAALDHVTAERVFYGNGLRQLNARELSLEGEKLQLSEQQDELVGVDLADAVTRLLTAKQAHDATLQVLAKTSSTSLLDYLR